MMLYNRNNSETVIPKDEFIEIANLPFKMTKAMMTETAFYAQNQSSFKSASEMIERALGLEIDSETVRKVSEHVGEKVNSSDVSKANEAYECTLCFPMKPAAF